MSEKIIQQGQPDIKTFNFYANSAILFFGFLVILYIYRKNNRSIRDEESYDWSKYQITTEEKYRRNRADCKEKTKVRTKEYSKGTGFIKDEHKFPITAPASEDVNKRENYLNLEEVDNLQDMINFAAEMNQNDKNPYPIESLYSQVLNEANTKTSIYTNEKIDNLISEKLKNTEIDENTRINMILELCSQLLKMKNKNLSDTTYFGLVEIFMKNGYLNHASYFLCQMDRLKIKIPRSLLDLFLDYSMVHNIFNKKEEITFKNNSYKDDKKNNKNNTVLNKYDKFDGQNDPDYLFYYNKKNQKKETETIRALFTRLSVGAKPYYPKTVQDEQYGSIQARLADIDTHKVKEYIPKNFKVVKKSE